MALKELNLKVVAYCEIPEEISGNNWYLQTFPCNCFIHWNLSTDSTSDNVVDTWLRTEYPELIGTDFLIEMDY